MLKVIFFVAKRTCRKETQMKQLEWIDFVVFGCYFVLVLGFAYWVSRVPKGHKRSAEDYFLAGRSLPWWIIGASLIASNISTEQIIGMNGTAFESGIAVISYSLIGAAIPLLLVARFFLPAFLKMKIYSMPEFLEKRYNKHVSTSMSVFWILVFVFVNLTSVLSLGAITLEAVLGIPLTYSIVVLALISAVYTIYGGLSAVAWTDFIQVGVLIIGGLAVVWLGLEQVSGGTGVIKGFAMLWSDYPDKFHTVLRASHDELPWTGVFLGGLWIAALSYWGCNQYIIQRALAAKSLREAQHGLLFASFLSIIVAITIVLPGVIASGLFADKIESRDQAFPVLIRELLPAGYAGLVIAALIAAIISSLNSMCNSVATIFTMDIYKKVINPDAEEPRLVLMGRIVTAIALLVAVLVAPTVAVMGKLFAFIQEYTGFVSPGVLCIFLFGLLWKKTTSNAALTAIILTIPISVALKFGYPEIAFLNRMMLTFIILSAVVFGISIIRGSSKGDFQEVMVNRKQESSLLFKLGSLFIIGMLGAFYIIFR